MVTNNMIQFLKELHDNNNKSWFDENRKRYEGFKSEYHNLTEIILSEMKKIDSSLSGLNTKDCVFRINKDIRFSKDKTPYKTYLGINMTPFGKKMSLASYYIHIQEGQSFVGGGLYMPTAELLNKARKEIHYFYDEFKQILEHPDFKNSYNALDENDKIKLVRPPKGYTEDDPAIEYLKLKSFTATIPIADKKLTDKNFVANTVEHLKALFPLIQFLNRGILSDENGGL